ncbi:thymidylate synthase [Bacillus phage P59]|nr:thymidylate synthase [Bacillus phage P59]
MKHADTIYKNFLKKILKEGTVKEDRTGTGTISLFGPQMEFDLSYGFPALTTKKVPLRVMSEELFFFNRGDTDLKSLVDKNVKIWTDDGYRFALENGFEGTKEEFIEYVKENGFSLGPIYGAQWRSWKKHSYIPSEIDEAAGMAITGGQHVIEEIDQLNEAIQKIKNNPDDRRIIVSAWNPAAIPSMALPPCHVFFQYYVADGKLSCKMYQRSADSFLGVPFNIASYGLETHLIAKMAGLEVGKLIMTFGDAHIYRNHLDQVEELLSRRPKKLPKLIVKTVHDRIEDYTIDDIEFVGYKPHPAIKAPLSVGL